MPIRFFLLAVLVYLPAALHAKLVAHFPLDEPSEVDPVRSTVGSYLASLRASGSRDLFDDPILGLAFYGSTGGTPDQNHGDSEGYLLTDYPGISGSNPRSVSIWFRTDPDAGAIGDTGNFDALFGWGQSATNRRYDFRVSGNDLRIEISGSGYTFPVASRGINIRDHEWHHVLLTYGGGNMANHLLYVDGSRIGFASGTAFPNTGTSTSLRIGTGVQRHHGSVNTARDFDGYLDDLGVFDTELEALDALLINALARVGGIDLRHLRVARSLAESPEGTVVEIAGIPWTKASGLPGRPGDFGGTVPRGDAFIVTEPRGVGIRMFAVPEDTTPDDFRIMPAGDIELSTGLGQATQFGLEIENLTDSHLPWKMVFEGEAEDPPALARALARLDDGIGEILKLLPDRHLFPDGIQGDEIRAGENGIYDSRGNRIDLDSRPLEYSDRLVRLFNTPGGSADYFTRKYDGLFVFAANLDNIEQFAITSDLSGGQDYSVSETEFKVGGRAYRGFIKQVFGTDRPSINHLTIVPDNAGITRVHRDDTQREGYGILGLEETSHLYYLLFSRPDGDYYDDATIAKVGAAFLEQVVGAPSWFSPLVDNVPIGPGESRFRVVPVEVSGLEAGEYSTRFAIVPTNIPPSEVPPENFQTLSLAVLPPEFSLEDEEVEVVTLEGSLPRGLRIPIVPSEQSSIVDGLEATTGAPWLLPSVSENRLNVVDLDFATTDLALGIHETTVTIQNESTTRLLTLRLHVVAPEPVVLKPDPCRDIVYGLNQNGADLGALLVLEPATATVLDFIGLGRRPSDFDISPDGKTLFAINAIDESISVVDLDSRRVIETIDLPEFENDNPEITQAHVRVGPGSVLYYVDGDWSPRLHVLDRESGAVIQSPIPPVIDDGIGDLAIASDFSALFAWTQTGWNAGSTGTSIVRFDILPDGTLSFHSDASPNPYTTHFEKDPLNTPVFITADGSTVIMKDRAINPANLADQSPLYPNEVFAATPGGELVSGIEFLYSGRTAEQLGALPQRSVIQTITPDYAYLVFYSAFDGRIRSYDLRADLDSAALGLDPFPADGAALPAPSALRWTPLEGIRSYDVYLGTDRSAVENANPQSAQFLATTKDRFLPLTGQLTPGQRYYWRVVPRRPDGSALIGAVSSFSVASITPSRSSIEVETVAGVRSHRETIELTSGSSQAWSASSPQPWIQFVENTGTTPSTLAIAIDASALEPGIHDGEVIIASEGSSFSFPVTLTLTEPQFALAVADRERPVIYAISQHSTAAASPSTLLLIDAETGDIDSAYSVGSSVTDLTIHYPENRIYLTNWEPGLLRAFDRDSLQEVQQYPFAPASEQDDDVFQVTAGRQGRLIVEEERNSIDIRLIDTADGQIIAETSGNEGAGYSSPDGRFYYHGGNRSTRDSLVKYDLASDSFIEAARADSLDRLLFTRLIFADQTGERIIWDGTSWDPDLNVRFDIGQPLLSGTRDGNLLFSRTHAHSGLTGEILAELPTGPRGIFSRNQAASPSGEKLFLFFETTYTVVDLAELLPLPDIDLTPAISDGSAVLGTDPPLGWSAAERALRYHVYLGSDPEAVAAAEPADPEYLGSTTALGWDGDLPELGLGQTYYWRVDVAGFADLRAGPVWSFELSAFDTTPREVRIVTPRGTDPPANHLELSAGTGQEWSATAEAPWIVLPSPAGTGAGSLVVEVMSHDLALGLHESEIAVTSGGLTVTIPVELEVVPLQISGMVADPRRDEVYVLTQNDGNPGWALAFDPREKRFTKSVPLGVRPADLALSNAGDALFVLNYGDPSISRVSLESFEVLDSQPLDNFSVRDFSDDPVLWTLAGKLAVGPGSVLYYSDGEWAPQMHVFDYQSGTVLQEVFLAAPVDELGVGGFLTTPDRTRLFAWEQSAWRRPGATFVGSFDIAPDGTLANPSATPNVFPMPATFYTSIVLSTDGTRLVTSNRIVDQRNLDTALATLPGQIHSMAPNGEFLVGEEQIFDGASGAPVLDLPVRTWWHAVTSDYSSLVYLDSESGAVDCLDLQPMHAEITELNVYPADASSVIAPRRLTWLPQTGIHQYDLYLGTDEAAVAAADPQSSSYLGRVHVPTYLFPSPLDSGQTHYWRVDPIEGGAATPGAVRSFSTSTLDLSTELLEADLLAGTSDHLFQVELTSTDSNSLEWSAASDSPWLSVESASGSTPATLVIRADTTGLEEGRHVGHVMVGSGEAGIGIEVRVHLARLRVGWLEGDPDRPLVYGISQTSTLGPEYETDYLFVLDTDREVITKSAVIGEGPSDLAVHAPENRLYIVHWEEGALRAYDLDTLTLAQEYHFDPGFDRDLGDRDIYYAAAGPAGRIIVNGVDNAHSAILLDTTTGEVLAELSVDADRGQGLGAFDPVNQFYYHLIYSTPTPTLKKYDLTGDSFQEVASAPEVQPTGGRLLISPDGSRLFTGQQAFDADLSHLFDPADNPVAMTSGGELLFGDSRTVMHGETGMILDELSEGIWTMAVSLDDQKLFMPEERHRASFVVLNLRDVTTVPPERLSPIIPDGSTIIGNEPVLSWLPEPYALSQTVYFGTDRAAVERAGPGDPECLGSTFDRNFPLANVLDYAATYHWRLEVDTLFETVRGPTWSFRVAPVDFTPRRGEIVWPHGHSVAEQTHQVSAPTATGWTASSSTPWITVLTPTGESPDVLRYELDNSALPLGTHQGSITLQAAGESFDLPVFLELIPLAIRNLEPDHDTEFVYGIHFVGDVAGNSDRRSFLVRIDARNERIVNFVPAGTWAADLAIHRAENRIYVPNPTAGHLLAFDPVSLQEVERYAIGPADRSEPNAVSRVSSGRGGRLIYEGANQHIDVVLVDTELGTVLDSVRESAGNGEFDPAGRYYYHGDSGSSGARLTKYDTNSDTLVEVADIRTTSFSNFGYASVRFTGDGSRLFWNGSMFDADLNELWALGSIVRAVDRSGLLVATEDALFNAQTRDPLVALIPDSFYRAISTEARKLVSSIEGELAFTDLSPYYPLAGAVAADPRTAPDEDWDADGFTNLFETALGMDPLHVDATSPLHFEIRGPDLVVSFPVGASSDDYDYRVEWSPNLIDWSPIAPPRLVTDRQEPLPRWEATVPRGQFAHGFLRLRADAKSP